jgi:small subunit ribosomal protein S6
MAKDPPLYDLIVLLDAEAPSERRGEIVAEVESLLSRGGAEVRGKHDWGVRQMSYEIAHRKDGDYRLFQFTAPPQLLEQLRTALKVMDGLLRHRIVKLAPGTPAPPAMRAEPRTEAPAEPPAEAPAETPQAS